MRLTLALATAAALLISGSAAPAANLKIDAPLRALRDHGPVGKRRDAGFAPRTGGPGSSHFSCFIQGRVTAADLAALGISVGTQAGGFASADLTWADIERLSAFPGVEAIRLSRTAKPLLDVSRSEIHANTVNGGTPPNYTGVTGRNVVVGVVDTGIDWNHADFKNSSGINRILYIWDQTTSGGAPSGFPYGKEWNAASILSGLCTEADFDGHGTHVTGTAAGSGRATGNGKANYRYVGIAPEADIIFVKTDFTFTHIVDGVNYIFQKAALLGKPAVVNLSLGSNYGPHDGTEGQDVQISALTGPGKIVCVSAGNSGGDSIHAEVSVVQADSDSVSFHVPSYVANNPNSQDDYANVDAYYHAGDTLRVQVRAPNGWISPYIEFGTVWQGAASASQGYIYVDNGSQANFSQPLSNGQYNLFIQVFDFDSTKTPAPGNWTIKILGKKVHSGGHVDLWLADSYLGVAGDIATWRRGFTPVKEVSTPGSADSVISVAAYMTKKQWQTPSGSTLGYGGGPYTLGTIAYFSSHGPSADGRSIPTIAAPGFGIASSRSSVTLPGSFMVDDSVHFMDQGTSMSCPHAVGVAALCLQKQPVASPALIKLAMISTALVDAAVSSGGTIPNSAWGYGKLRADAALSTTPVALFELDGEESESGFTVSWAVAEGASFGGFNVERAASLAGTWTVLNPKSLAPSARRFEDHPTPGIWYYRVTGLAAAASTTIGPFRAEVTGAGTLQLKLLSPVPNPFREASTLTFVLPGSRSTQVDFSVFDVVGRRVATLYDGFAQAGRHDVSWDGRTLSGVRAGAGLYFARLTTDFGSRSRKIALLP